MQQKTTNQFRLHLFVLLLFLSLTLFSGCTEEQEQADPSMLVLESLQVTTRSGYTEEFYKDSVLEVFITATNKDIHPGTFTLTLFVDDKVVDEKNVLLNASEDKTVKLTNIELTSSGFPLTIKGIDTVGTHSIRINNVSTTITVQEPPVEVDIQTIEWRETDQGWRPWITLEVYNTADTLFYLGKSFAINTSEEIYLGTIESWEIILGDDNQTGFYPLPPESVAEVEFTSYDLTSNNAEGSDIHLESIIVYAGFPWMDATAGIIGEQKIV